MHEHLKLALKMRYCILGGVYENWQDSSMIYG